MNFMHVAKSEAAVFQNHFILLRALRRFDAKRSAISAPPFKGSDDKAGITLASIRT
jgi:hypothetical protein